MNNWKHAQKVLILLALITAPAILFPKTPQEALLIVHGTFSKDAEWFTENGEFQTQVQKSVKKTSKKIKAIPFVWSGQPHYQARINAAIKLAEKIISLKDLKKLFIVGHSHGCNVVAFASILLELAAMDKKSADRKQKLIIKRVREIAFEEHLTGKTVLQSAWLDEWKNGLVKLMGYWNYTLKKTQTVLSKLKLNKIANFVANTSYGVESAKTILEMLQSEDSDQTYAQTRELENTVTNAVSRLKILLEQNNLSTHQLTIKPLINSAFLLACPVDDIASYPSPKIIKKAYNLYSHADLVQRVFGIYKRRFENNNSNVINIPVVIKESRKAETIRHPGHNDMHNPCIARWLFYLPNLFMNRSSDMDSTCCAEFYEDFARPQIVLKQLKTRSL
ncbi:hypothetical protein KAU11_02315 [Candidatus Babeliales bacterium]|nr:hypothetical protein [Candidatus Babeliales bacterium]